MNIRNHNRKLLLIAALALLAGMTQAPVNAATDPYSYSVAKITFDFKKGLSVTSSQKAVVKKKVTKNSGFSVVSCELSYSNELTSSQIKQARTTAKKVCAVAKGVNKNLIVVKPENDAPDFSKGKKFYVFMVLSLPRMVSFQSANGFTGNLPNNSAVLKYNSTYTIPNVPQGLEVDGGTFKNWNTSPDGTGLAFLPGDKVKVKVGLMLYPIATGYEIDINIESLYTAVGNTYELRFTAPGDSYSRTSRNGSVSIDVTTDTSKTISLHLPGSADESSFTLSENVTLSYIGWGTCPDNNFVENECTVTNFTYTGEGSITFNHVPLS